MKKILSYSFLFLLLSLPFERLLTFDISGFTVKFSYIFTIIFILLTALYFFQKKQKPSLKIDEISMLLFVVWSYMTIFWSIDKEKTFIISSMLLLIALLYISVKKFFEEGHFINIPKYYIWLSIAASIFGLWQFFSDNLGMSQSFSFLGNDYIRGTFPFPRIQSTFFEPLYFAHFLLICIYLAIYRIVKKENRRFFWILLLILGLSFFLTLSRGAYIALAVTIILALVSLIIWSHQSIVRFMFSLGVLAVSLSCALSLIYFFSGRAGIKTYFSQTLNAKDYLSGNDEKSREETVRGYTIQVALNNWQAHPFLGVGTGTFGSLPEFEKVRAGGNPRQTVNSLYPEILVEEGVIGLILFGLFLFFLFRQAFISIEKKDRLKKIILMAAVLALFIQYASFSTLYIAYVWIFVAWFSIGGPQMKSEQL